LSYRLADLGDNDPFAGDVNFGIFVNQTGGKLFYNRNDIDKEINRSLQVGAEYSHTNPETSARMASLDGFA